MMKNPSKTYDIYDVVVVPFPFVNSAETKRRPAIVLSSDARFNNRSRSCVMAMITTATHAPWPCDVEISDLDASGLPVKSIIRMKLFTIDQRLIIKCVGKLGKIDQKTLSNTLKTLLSI